jgi:hypothetical protein
MRRIFTTAMVGALLLSVAPAHATLAPLSQSSDLVLRGIDKKASLLIATGEATIRQSSDWGRTWSANKGLPGRVGALGRSKVKRFGHRLYLMARSRGGRLTVWSTREVSGNQPFTWRRELTGATGSSDYSTTMNADKRFVYVGEYGDPEGGPSIYRSSGNGEWRRVWGPKLGWRHVHAVAPDPFVPGDVYATVGDGVGTSLIRSRHYGAGPWRRILPGRSGHKVLQSVQISFDRKRIWLAADAARRQPDGSITGSTALIVNRSTWSVREASSDYHYRLPVPNRSGEHFLANAYWGAVNRGTGDYYCVTATGSPVGSVTGMFRLGTVGGPLEILDSSKPGLVHEVFFAHGEVWSGRWHQALAG